VLQGVGGVGERRGGRGDDPLPQSLQRVAQQCWNLQYEVIIDPLISNHARPYCRLGDCQ
jgi:hypothetical protein